MNAQIDQNGNGNTFKRRTRVPDKPNYTLNLWSIIKSFIGQDLTKIPIPVNFNEPISMLQRSAEDFEYSELLDKAAQSNDIVEQLSLVAAFTMSTYSTTSDRVAKPFNPLLSETYECDRMTDMGWKLISEQVSHHPPVLAQFCESVNDWKCSQELQLTSSFRGQSISAIPITFSRIEFPSKGVNFTFDRPTTTVHNLIVGKLYVEQTGDVTILGEGKAAGWKCVLSYKSQGFFSKEMRRVKGVITDPCDVTKATLSAQWDDKMEVIALGLPPKVIWTKRPPPSDAYLYYNFTIFASQLNQLEDNIAPTDSRNRPDQRLMENGEWDGANREKLRLEELQRERRRNGQDIHPTWFRQEKDVVTGKLVYKYAGNYWESKNARDWSKCSMIF